MTIHLHIHDSGPAPAHAEAPPSPPLAAGEAPLDASEVAAARGGATDAGAPPAALVAEIEAALGARATPDAAAGGDHDAGAAPA
jgi:hypothetical protein